MITSTANSLVKQIRALQSTRKARTSEGLFVLEGRRLMQEIVITQTPVKYALHVEALSRDERSVLNSLARLGADVQLVSDKVMTACSSAESPSHILAVVPQLEGTLFTPKTSRRPPSVILPARQRGGTPQRARPAFIRSRPRWWVRPKPRAKRST